MEVFIALLLLILLMIIGVPVPFSFFDVTIFLIITLNYDSSFLIPYGFSQVGNFVLLAIPLFIIAGGMMDKGGIGERIVDFAELFVGKIKGGLGVVAVVACAIFGSISGSGSAALTSIGSIIMPRLVKRGYPRGFTAALVTNASVLGLLIPPSGLMILYAWSSGQSVLASFLSTVIPGLIVATLLIIINLIYFKNKDFKEVVGVDKKTNKSFKQRSISAAPGLLMPIIILGGIYGGIMTPTEAAALSVVYAIPIGIWLYKGINRKNFFEELVNTGTTTGSIMIMLFGIMILSRILVMENIPDHLKNLLFSITENGTLLLLMINIFLIILGMLMDDASAVLLATPILLPIVINLGVDPIHFAAIVGVNLGMGTVTPPTAPLLYLGVRVGKSSINEMLGPTMIMILFAWLPTLIITTYIPELSLFLPRLLLGY